jgi:hypothetical protein
MVISFFEIGEKYLIRTVTMYLTGIVRDINEKELLLSNAAWIADTGRFHDALKNGTFSEIEPFIDDVIVNRESIVDATKWRFELPLTQK